MGVCVTTEVREMLSSGWKYAHFGLPVSREYLYGRLLRLASWNDRHDTVRHNIGGHHLSLTCQSQLTNSSRLLMSAKAIVIQTSTFQPLLPDAYFLHTSSSVIFSTSTSR